MKTPNKESVLHIIHDGKFSQGYLPDNWDNKMLLNVNRTMINAIKERFNPETIIVKIYSIEDFLHFNPTKGIAAADVVAKLRADFKAGKDKITIL